MTAGVKAALQAAGKEQELVIICGSAFIMAEARETLGFDEPKVTHPNLTSSLTRLYDAGFSLMHQDAPVISEVAGKHLKSAQVGNAS